MNSVTDRNVEGDKGIELSSILYEIVFNDLNPRGDRFSPPDKCIKLTKTHRGGFIAGFTLEPHNVRTIYNFIQKHYTKEYLEQ